LIDGTANVAGRINRSRPPALFFGRVGIVSAWHVRPARLPTAMRVLTAQLHWAFGFLMLAA